MGIIKYKQYPHDELQDTFFHDPVFFSRSSVFRAGCPGRADVVLAFLEEETIRSRRIYSVVIRAELQNQVEYVNSSLLRQGYNYNECEGSVWTKTVRILNKEGSDSLNILRDTLTALDDLVDRLPLYLYESIQVKRLRDYVNFVTAWESKTRLTFRGWIKVEREAPKRDRRRASHSQYLRRGFGRLDDLYYIAKLSNRQWCAWIDGDEYIPVFTGERFAVRFLEERHELNIG